MSKAAIIKAQLHQSDKYRAILSDTAPYELPIIFSNDGFYKNLVRYNTQSMSPQLRKLVDALIFEPRQYTVPLRYDIVKDAESTRTLSLVHPHGQVQIAEFYGKYDQLICEYAGRSPYSMRHPKQVGTMFFFKCELADKNKYKNSSVTQQTMIISSEIPPAIFHTLDLIVSIVFFSQTIMFGSKKSSTTFCHSTLASALTAYIPIRSLGQ